jgi:hypothetical protein
MAFHLLFATILLNPSITNQSEIIKPMDFVVFLKLKISIYESINKCFRLISELLVSACKG